MDFQISFLKPAILDLEEQTRYKAAEESEEAALFHAQQVFQAADRLKQFPNKGKPLPQLGSRFRELILGPNYHLVYEVDSEAKIVYIYAVIHSRQDFLAAWRIRKRL